MNGHGEKLSRRHEQAIAALLEQTSIKAAAASLSIGERTLRTWLKRPDFQAAFRAARTRLLEHSAGRLTDASTEAVKTLKALLKAEAETVRLQAARTILELGVKLKESIELEQRVAELEANEPAREEP